VSPEAMVEVTRYITDVITSELVFPVGLFLVH